MLTIKKRARICSFFLAALLAVLAGCTPPGPRALLGGEQLIKQGRYPQAQEKLEQAVRLLPNNAQAWNHLGLAYHYSAQPAKAEQCYQKAISLDRNLAPARFNLGCLQLEQKNFAAAVDPLTTFVSLQPNSKEGWLKLGSAQLGHANLTAGPEKMRELDAAKRSFDTAQHFFNSAEALNGLGVIQVQRGRARDAAALFQNALQQQPAFAPAHLNLAVIYHQSLNDRPAALQKYRDYLATHPRGTEASAIENVVRQLDLELNPPRLVTPTNPVPSIVISSNTNLLPATNVARTATNVVRPLVTTTNVRPTITATNPAPRMIAAVTNREPLVEVTKVTNEPPVKPARDARPDEIKTPPVAETRNAPPVATIREAPATTTDTTPPPKEGFLQKINPANLFRRKPKSSSPVASSTNTTVASKTEPTPLPEISPAPRSSVTPLPPKAAPARYNYKSPRRPPAGDRRAADPFFARGLDAQSSGKLSEAVEAYRQATRLDPSFAEAYYNLGLADYDAGDLAGSLTAYEFALALKPSAGARYNFALALQKANFPQDAANELEKLLKDTPNETRAHLVAANLYAQSLYQPHLARPHYLKVLELEPNHPEATNIRYWLASNP
jgi:tetratricopeptide (TPR) repeat protein